MVKGEGSLESLHDLLADRNADPARAKEIDREINDRFSCRRAVHVLDMSGFSVSTRSIRGRPPRLEPFEMSISGLHLNASRLRTD